MWILPRQPLTITSLDMTRVCRSCGIEKRITQFRRKHRRKDPVTDQRHVVCARCQEKAHPSSLDRIRKRIFDVLGRSCACCGETTPEFLTLDHIGNTGAEHRRSVGRSTRAIYAAAERSGLPRDQFRILCFNCNCSIGAKGYCPHNPDIRYPVIRRKVAA